MIPKVKAAIVSFVAPIASSQLNIQTAAPHLKEQNSSMKKKKNGELSSETEERFEDSPTADAQGAQIIPLKPLDNQQTKTAENGIADSFLQLIINFREKRGNFLKRIAAGSYRLALKNRKSSANLKKGCILDQQVD